MGRKIPTLPPGAHLLVLIAAMLLLWKQTAYGQVPPPQNDSQAPSDDLTQVSIENLMNVEVGAASKKAEKLLRTAAAVFVITQEDVRRSGATNIPDLLRMVPGLDVAQINASNWAISSRGFNERFADMEENKIQFEVNLEAAQKAKLKISSRLLMLAKKVIGGQRGD